MQKTSLILALALAFTPAVWAENVNINGTGVSMEANKTPVNTAKNSGGGAAAERLSLRRAG
jgi:polar amino acid transport system substrate-binding protein